MPIITAAIDPVSRIEGHLKIEVKVDTVNGRQQVVDAFAVGTMFRGFERLLENRDPRDAALITSRICGVCPTAHSQAAAVALDTACGVTPPTAGRLMRNLVHGAGFLESDVLHFYILSAPDYVQGPGMAPWTPGLKLDRRVDPAVAATLVSHYLAALNIRRKAHEMGAILGGRLPHTPAFIAGGFTAVPTADDKARFQSYLTEITDFIRHVYLPDAELLASIFPDYFGIGGGYGSLLSFGGFELNDAGTSRLMNRGRVVNGVAGVQPVDTAAISEFVTRAWYDESTNNRNPASGATVPTYPKDQAYSWIKAPRYGGVPYEVGPLARMTIDGDYTNGVSVMDRHLARAREALKIAEAMQPWLDALSPGAVGYTPCSVPVAATSIGLTEASRGALGHWLAVAGSKIQHYQIITPTCWNCSPRDSSGKRGPLEQALMGVPVENVDEPVEVLRVIHSIDPCLDCATHVTRAGAGVKVYALGGVRWTEPLRAPEQGP